MSRRVSEGIQLKPGRMNGIYSMDSTHLLSSPHPVSKDSRLRSPHHAPGAGTGGLAGRW